MSKILFICLLLVCFVSCKHGVDLDSPVSFSNYQCLLNAGVQFFIVRGYTSDGEVDSSAYSNLRLVQQLGITADLSMQSCRVKDATNQANDMLDSIPSNTYNKVWVVVQSLKGTCDWGTMPANLNCEYLKQIIAAVKARGKQVGIYSDYYAWQRIFKTLTACPEVGQYDLWYGYNDHEDNFNSYKSFGGFGFPAMKAYADVLDLCGISLGLDYKL